MNAKRGISKQIKVSWTAKLNFSVSYRAITAKEVSDASSGMDGNGTVPECNQPIATRIETPKPCQNEKKMIPLTHKN
jgi:hypothetical protein